MLRQRLSLALLITVTALSTGCGPSVVRGSAVEGLDDEAFGTGLDRRDLETMLNKNMKAMQSSAVIARWQKEERPALAVLRIRNETSEHLDSALQAMISDIETIMINAGHVRVISQESQPGLVEEVRRQHSGAFDPSQVSKWGKQVGARYFITGKVFSVDERKEDERRVQYFLFMQVLDAETGDILFQNKTSVTKAIVN